MPIPNNNLNTDNELEFDSNAQSAVMKQLSSLLIGGVQSPDALDPLAIFDAMSSALAESGADAETIAAVVSLKDDPEIVAEITKFQQALDGDGDISTVGAAPLAAAGVSGPTYDPGLNAQVLLGNDNDLVRYSDYISGAGSSVGGFIPGLPGLAQSFTQNSVGINRVRNVVSLKTKLRADVKAWNRTLEANKLYKKTYGVDIDVAYRQRRDVNINTISGESITLHNSLSPKDKLGAQVYISANELKRAKVELKGLSKTQKTLAKVGKGVKIIGSGFSIAQGGVSIAAGDAKLDTAWGDYQNGDISRADYDKIATGARLRIAGGALGIGKGVANIAELVTKKVAKNLGTATAKKAARFAPIVGGIISVGLGALSITKNSMAANDARLSGNHGRAAMFGVMAALDSVTLVLDAVSTGLDFIPGIGTAVSFVVDLVSTVIGLFSDLIGFFTEAVDTRTPTEKLQADFNDYITSAEFKSYIDGLADTYKEQGYDVLEFHIDPEAAELGDDEAVQKKIEAKEITRQLTDKAKEDIANLRIALIDNTFGDKVLETGPADDLINVLGEGNKTLNGLAGNDILLAGAGNDYLYGGDGDDSLFGGAGNDYLYGGAGNDYLDGGFGVDQVFGEEGDDTINLELIVDTVADGGSGNDTLLIHTPTRTTHIGTQLELNYRPPVLVSEGDHGALFRSGAWQWTDHIAFSDFTVDLNEDIIQLSVDEQYKFDVQSLSQLWEKTSSFSNRSIFTYVTGDSSASIDRNESMIQDELEGLFSNSDPLSNDFATEVIGKELWFIDKTDVGDTYFTDGVNLYKINDGNTSVVHKSVLQLSDFGDAISRHNVPNGKEFIRGFFDPNRFVQAQLYTMFQSGTDISGIENLSLTQYGNYRITGDEQNNVIRAGHEVSGTFDAGAGNDTIIVEDTTSGTIGIKTIDGGDGYDTLILKGQSLERYGSWAQRDAPFKFTLDDYRSSGHGVYKINGIESVVLEGRNLSYDKPFILNAGIQSPLNITVNVDSRAEVTTSLNDGTLRIIKTGDNSRFINLAGNDTLDLSAVAEDVNVGLKYGQITGAFNASFINFNTIIAGRGSDQVIGDRWDNLLVAQSGQDQLFGKEGDDHLISRVGRHHLSGGEGNDLYTISNSRITDRQLIQVSSDSHQAVSASSKLGQWQDGKLTIDVLGDDKSFLTLDPNSVRLVDRQGNEITSKGAVSVVDNQLVFQLGNDFASLAANGSDNILVEYESVGSYTKITENSLANTLSIKGVSGLDSLTFTINDNNELEARNLDGELVFVDTVWAEKLNAGQTDLFDLALDFSRRFQQINFSETDGSDLVAATQSDIYTRVADQVGLLIGAKNVGRDWNIFTKASSMSGPLNIAFGGGDDVFYSDRFGKVAGRYINTGAGDDIIVATEGSSNSLDVNAGTREYSARDIDRNQFIVTGEGNDTVVIGNSERVVNIELSAPFRADFALGKDTLVIENYGIEEILIKRDITYPNLLKVFNIELANGRVLARVTGKPAYIAFQEEDRTWLIDDTTAYLQARVNNQSYIPRIFVDINGNQGISLTDINADQVQLSLASSAEGLTLNFNRGNDTLYSLVVPDITQTTFDVRELSSFISGQLAGGVEFSDQTLTTTDLEQWLVDVSQDDSRFQQVDDVTVVQEAVAVQEVSSDGEARRLNLLTKAMVSFNADESLGSVSSAQQLASLSTSLVTPVINHVA